jgi:hypothetical protein
VAASSAFLHITCLARYDRQKIAPAVYTCLARCETVGPDDGRKVGCEPISLRMGNVAGSSALTVGGLLADAGVTLTIG